MSHGLAEVSATLRKCHVLTNNAMDVGIFDGHVRSSKLSTLPVFVQYKQLL